MSSLLFIGDETSYLRIPNTNEFNFGTGDFTIEWYQYQTDDNSFPRIFQAGSFDEGTSIGVSIEGGTFYYWTNSSANSVDNLSDYKNQWVHFAICRADGVTQVFKNGVSIFNMNDSNDFNSTSDLVIGNESTPSNDTAFGGYITYFSYVKGVALYTSDFTVSNTYPALTGNTVLLLKSGSFEGTLGSTVVNNGVGTTSNVPPGFSSTPPPPVIRNWRSLSSLFSNNAAVYYKPGSLASGGVGSVRNSSAKARKT